MSEIHPEHSRADLQFTVNDFVRFFLEIFVIVSFAVWGFAHWAFPVNIAFGVLTPVVAIVLWGLFRSPKAVFGLDAFGKGLVEIVIMAAAAFAWWNLGQPVIAVLVAVVATVSGIINGRREFR